MSWNDDTQKWEVDVMSDDRLDPTSLVGRMLRPKPMPEPPATVEPLPLWRAMDKGANPFHFANMGTHGDIRAAEIEAMRDWLLPEEPEPVEPLGSGLARWDERQRLRALLTKQARIARGD